MGYVEYLIINNNTAFQKINSDITNF